MAGSDEALSSLVEAVDEAIPVDEPGLKGLEVGDVSEQNVWGDRKLAEMEHRWAAFEKVRGCRRSIVFLADWR